MSRKVFAFKFFVPMLLAIIIAGCADPEPDHNLSVSDGNDNGNNEAEGSTEIPEGAEESESSVTLAWNSQPPTLDPHVTNTNVVRDLARPIFEQLVTFDGDYEPAPMLAESFEESDDGSVITFYLREGVIFHNGEEMTADDVVASMEKWQSTGAAQADLGGSTWEALDEYTVEVTVEEPSVAIMYRIADVTQAAAIMPEEVIEGAGSTGVEEYIGTGPFQVEEWQYDSYIHLTKFDDYQALDSDPDGLTGRKEAMVDDIFVQFVTDDSTRVNGLISGEYDYAYELSFDSFDQLENAENIVTDVWPFGFQTLVFNKQGIFEDVDLRQAVNYALDNEDLLSLAFTSEEFYSLEPAFMRPEQVSWYTDAGSENYNITDPDRAQELLEEAGYEGEEITILTSSDYSYHYDSAIITQEVLESIGMNVTLDVTDWATLLDRRADPELWDIFYTQFTTVPTPLAYPFLDSEAEYPGWTNNPDIDRLLDEIRNAPSQEESTAAFEELQAEIWEDLPVINVGMTNFISGYSEDVEGYSEFMGPIFWNMSVNE